MVNALQDFVDLLVGGVTNMAGGLGEGINSYVTDLFFKTGADGVVEGLSNFAGITGIFGGVALAVGITSMLFMFVRSLGN